MFVAVDRFTRFLVRLRSFDSNVAALTSARWSHGFVPR